MNYEGIKNLCRDFSFPGGVSSHVAPSVPGSIKKFTSIKIFVKKNMYYILCCSNVMPTGITQIYNAVCSHL